MKVSLAIKIILVVLSVVVVGGLIYRNRPQPVTTLDTFPELTQIQSLSTYDQSARFFEEVAKNKGGEYAYRLLAGAPLPPNIDTHLLGHKIGDVLYKQRGADGIKVCTQDFRNACSHSIVVGLLSDKGEAALSDIAAACRLAPGGIGAYTMCFHGLGHGVLSYIGYDIQQAIPLCQKTGTQHYGYREGVECIGGMVMEAISGGFHDKEIWARQRPNFLNPKNPTALCEQKYMPESAKGICYTYITPYLFEAAGADIANPGPKDFAAAFKYCNVVPKEANRLTCFGGFGKEFPTLVNNRDIRGIDQLSREQLRTVYEWCQLAQNLQGINACVEHAIQSLYWGGENSYEGGIRFCSEIDSGNTQDHCFRVLTSAVNYYISDPIYKKNFCNQLPDTLQGQCIMAI